MSMEIKGSEGRKIAFKHPNAGYKYDQDLAKEHLELDKVYTIRRLEVHSWSSQVWLEDISGDVSFNTVLFDDVK